MLCRRRCRSDAADDHDGCKQTVRRVPRTTGNTFPTATIACSNAMDDIGILALASERILPLTKPPAIPLHSVAANRTSLTAIYVDRRDTGLIRHVDFQDVPSPNLAKIASFGNKNAMKAAVRRTKCISVETLYLVEVDCDKLHAFLSFQVSQEARSNIYCVASAQ